MKLLKLATCVLLLKAMVFFDNLSQLCAKIGLRIARSITNRNNRLRAFAESGLIDGLGTAHNREVNDEYRKI